MTPAAPRFVPAEDRVDRRQLAALVRLQLGQMLRRGTDASSKMSGSPLRQILFTMSVLGVLAAGGAFRAVEADVFVARLFGSALVIVALAITAEADDARIERLEILLPKPVSGPTHLAAVALQLLVTSALVVVPYALPSLLAAVVRLGLAPWRVPLLLATLLCGAFTVVLVWVLLLRAGTRRLGADRVRMITQTATVAVIVLLAWTGVSASLGSAPDAPVLPERALDALPSTWLARFWLDDWGAAANLRRAGAVALMSAAVVGFLLFSRRAPVDSFLESTSRVRRTRLPLLARLLLAVPRMPLGRLLLPPPVAALAGGLVTVGSREEASRLRGFPNVLIAAAMVAWGFWSEAAGLLPIVVLASLTISMGLDGLAVARQSAQPDAAWMVAKSPLGPGQLVRAVLWAVTLRFVLPPLAFFSVLAFRRHAWYVAGLFVLGGLALARFAVASTLALHPSVPLSDPPRVGGIAGQLAAWAVGMAGATAYAVAASLLDFEGMIAVVGLSLVVGGTAALLVMSVVAQIVATDRLSRFVESA